MKLLLAIPAVITLMMLGWGSREHREPPAPPFPEKVVPIGTNELRPGTDLFTLATRTYKGKVRSVDCAHHFPEGDIAPAVLIERDTMKIWIRRQHLAASVIALP